MAFILSMWHKIINYLKQHWDRLSKQQKYLLVFVCLLTILSPLIALAAVDKITEALLQILTGIVSLLVTFVGSLLAIVLHALIWVAQYNNFINESVVREGWKVVRDICNMFFVLGLLIIAFGTVLRLQNYQAKSNLKSFIFGAIFVNFSKTICGLILDFAQVIMLTFVNGFKDVGAGNLTEMLGITTLFNVVTNNADATAVASAGIFVSYLLALIYLIVALVVILTMTIMLIQRAVMLWLFIVLSPFPYLLSALPKSGKIGQMASRWWTDFTGLVITGPLLAFFIWLSFFTVSDTGFNKGENIQVDGPSQSSNFVTDINAGVTKGGTADAIIKFLVSIGILWGGMMLTKEASSLVGGTIGAGMGSLSKMGNFAKKTASRAAVGKVKDTAKWASRNALKGAGGLMHAVSKNSNSKVGQAAQKIGLAAKTWGNELTEERTKEKTKKRLGTLKKLGLGVGEETMKRFQDVADDDVVKGVGKTYQGAKRFVKGSALGILTGNPLVAAAAIAGSGFSGLIKSPFNKTIGQTLKQGVNNSKVMAYEDAYSRRHTAIDNAAGQMNKTRKDSAENRDAIKEKAEQAFRSGHITKGEYENIRTEADKKHAAKVDESIKTYKTTKAEATNQMHREFADIKGGEDNRYNNYTLKKLKEEQSKHKEKSPEWNNYENQIKSIDADKINYGKKASWVKSAAWLSAGSGVKSLGENIENYHPFQTSSDAAGLFLKNSKEAEKTVKSIAGYKDPADLAANLSPKTFSGGLNNLDDEHGKFWKALANPKIDGSQDAIKNLEASVGKLDPNKQSELAIIQSIMKGLSTFEKSGGDVSRFNDLKSALDNTGSGKDYKDYLSNAKSVKLRQVNAASIGGDGDGSLRVNSFAGGKHQANIIGADFGKLSSLGDISSDGLAAGANIPADKMAAVASELTGLINDELSSLKQSAGAIIDEPLDSLEQKIADLRSRRSAALSSGDIDSANQLMPELEQASRVKDLRVAKDKLADPATLSNLSLKNTGVSMISARESVTTNMHEALHGFGLNDETLTESVARQMASGSYRIDDAGGIAQSLKNIMTEKGLAQNQLTAEDIAQAIQSVRPLSQAASVIAKESGQTVINIGGDGKSNNNQIESKLNKIINNDKDKKITEDYRYFHGLKEDKKNRDYLSEKIKKSSKRGK